MQKIILEKLDNDNLLVGRVYVNGNRTSAYIVPSVENEYLFTSDQLNKIKNAEASDMF